MNRVSPANGSNRHAETARYISAGKVRIAAPPITMPLDRFTQQLLPMAPVAPPVGLVAPPHMLASVSLSASSSVPALPMDNDQDRPA